MKDYIGVKAIKAQPMSLAEFNQLKGSWSRPGDLGALDRVEDESKAGYLVEYDTGYQSWSPKEAFERSYLELTEENKITEDVLERFIGNGAISHKQLDAKTTLVRMEPRTGFVQYEASSCVDPENYDHELGLEIATKRLKHKLWPMLGFVLQWARYGLR